MVPESPSPAHQPPSADLLPVSLEDLAQALAVPARWVFLRELARGEALPVAELARRTGITPNLASKHLMVLRELKLVEQVYARLYRLASTLRVDASAGLLDLGFCLLRLDPPSGRS